MQIPIIVAIQNFLRPLWVRIAIGVGIIILVGGGMSIYMLLKDKTVVPCSELSCQKESPAVQQPNDREKSSESESAAMPEEGKKAEEKKNSQPNITTPGSTSNGTSQHTGGSSTANPGGSESPPLSDSQGCPAYPAFPTGSCTGVPSGTTLSSVTTFSTSSNGQTINGLLITGDLVINHDNITVTNSRIKGRVAYNGHRGLTLRDVDLGPDSCPISNNGGVRLLNGDDYILTRVHLHHNGDDLLAMTGGGTILIQDSLFNNTCYYAGDHLDAIQYYDPGGVANVTLLHNTLDARPANNSGFGNAAIFWGDFPGAGTRLNVRNNFLAGGNYTFYALDAASGSGVIIDISGNRFLRNTYTYGPCALTNSDPFDGASGIKWNNNAYSDGAAIAINDC